MRFIQVIKHRYYFKSEHGLSGEVLFGLVPKWAEDINSSKRAYNARHEDHFGKPSFQAL